MMTKATDRGTKGYLAYKTATLGISLGNGNSYGARIQAIANWLPDKFSHIIIDLSDTLNRYNYMAELGLTEKAAADMARQEGDEWLKNHLAIFDGLGIDYSVARWDERLKHPAFETEFVKFKAACDNNADFRTALDTDILAFLKRRGKILQDLTPEQHRLHRLYLLEEITCHSIHFQETPSARVYPGKEQESYRFVASGKLTGVHTGLKSTYYTRLWLIDQPVNINEWVPNKPSNDSAPILKM